MASTANECYNRNKKKTVADTGWHGCKLNAIHSKSRCSKRMAIGFILRLSRTKSHVIYWLHFVILTAIFLACIFCFAHFSLQFEPDIRNKFKFELIHDNLAKPRSFTARTKPNIDGFYWKSSSSYRIGIYYFNKTFLLIRLR